MPKNQQCCSPFGRLGGEGWRQCRVTKMFDKQSDAVERARDISQRQHSELLVHGGDAHIRARDSHGPDCCREKDKK